MPILTTAQTALLNQRSRDIHAHPELAYQERHALGAIAAVLERHGHRVERGIGGLETAFRTRVGPEGPAIALLAEYDALPDVGHGCGPQPDSDQQHRCVSRRRGQRGSARGRGQADRHARPSTARVHGIIREGGVASNIIPSRAVGDFGIRAAEMDALKEMVSIFEDMAKGAALQTGTKVTIEEEMRPYLPVEANPKLGDALAEELVRRGKSPSRGHLVTASGDIGNISQKVPTDYIGFPVSAQEVPGHSHKMREASVSDYAQESAFVVIASLAATTLRIATDRVFRESLRK